MKIFFSVGEPSGDLHGANLIRRLRAADPGLQAVGYGGPKMAAAGCRLHYDLTQLAVIGFFRALMHLHHFYRIVVRADRYFRHHRPDAVVLVDFPGLNWWIARRAKVHGIPVFYYTPPQIWAWGSWRVHKMRRLVDHVLCSLPFEQAWFRERQCHATFVGHPYFDEVREQHLDRQFVSEHRARRRGGLLVTILPGSRTHEVTNNLKGLLRAAALVADQVPGIRFAVAAFKPYQAELARRIIAEHAPDLPIETHVGRTPELIHLADCCLAVSGSVSLELLYHTKPTVIVYYVLPWVFQLQAWFRKVKYITLVNLLSSDRLYDDDLTLFDPAQPDADQVPFPEYLTCEDRSPQIAAHLCEWLTDSARREARVAQLEALKQRVAHGGASARAARYILRELRLAASKRRPPVPHFAPTAPPPKQAAA